MEIWELAILVAVAALCIGTVYLVTTLKKLTQAVDRLDKLVENNTSNINEIINDLNCITKETKEMTLNVTNSVKNVGNAISAPAATNGISSFVSTAKKAADIISIALVISKMFGKKKKNKRS